MKIIRIKKSAREKILYLFFGGLTTIVNFIVYFSFTRFFSLNYLFSNIAAWFAAVGFAYATNRKFVFTSAQKEKALPVAEATLFFGLRALSGAADNLFMYILVSVLCVNDGFFKAAGQCDCGSDELPVRQVSGF